MRAHSKEISLDKGTSDLESVNLEKRKSALKRRNVSVIWSFFTKSNANERLATCNLCSKLFSYKTSTSNLSTHLKRLHPNEFWESKTDDNESGDDDTVEQSNSDDEPKSTEESDPWSFFEKETGGRARCVVCRASLPHRIKDLKQHLKNNHPKLAQGFDESSDSDDQNEPYTEIVYLDEETRTIKKPQKNSRVFTTPVKPAKISKLSKLNTSDNERHEENDDQIKKFSNYVASLLKEVPKDACMKLQMDIINLIMTTKLKLPTEERKIIIDGVPVAIQAVPGAEFIMTVPTTASGVSTPNTTVNHKPTVPEDTKPINNEYRDLPKL
ncbi:PREDICTED: uncharacterized protein LOC106101235 isoform X2 [Papilio polytes]|nr:PREDICTED: uncharacterized protein LOC106101235 isoform X2 [Papilio polytes]